MIEPNRRRVALGRLALCLALTVGGCGGEMGEDAGSMDAGGAPDAGPPDAGPTPDPCPGGCLVGTVCFPDGARDPVDPCRVCDAARSTTEMSPDEGAFCDDGSFCTVGDRCSAEGECAGSARGCDDSIACNGAETCDEDADACVAGAPTCTGGEVCDAISGECVLECSGCLIGGTCFGDGQVDPLNPCRRCEISASRSSWSDRDGVACDDGQFCTVGTVCGGGACGGGSPRDCDDGVACNGAESCDDPSASCVAGVTSCGTDEICDVASDVCVPVCTGCVIGGSCYGDGQRNPANPCEVCDVATSATAWSPNGGARCDDGLFCTTGDTCAGTTCGGVPRPCDDGVVCNGVETCDETGGTCQAGTTTCGGATVCDVATDACVTTCTGCVIGGACYGDGQRNPANPCEVCDVARSASAWSDNDGARCDDGQFCTEADRCSGGACAGSAVDCSDGVACNGVETCDEPTDACLPGTSTCASTEVCDVTTDRCVTTCAGCVIGGVCFADGSTNPANPCEICDAATSSTAWTDADGRACDDGAFCTRGDTCSGGSCAGTASSFCSDGVACNGVESCNEATDRCDPGATTCGAGTLCDVSTDSCVTACGGCVIGGVCYADGTRDPANPCQVCDVAASPSAWTPFTGASCDDGLFCTTGDACTAAAVCEGSARGCSDGVACNGTESCNESTDRCDPGVSTCTGGRICDVGTDTCVLSCVGGTTLCAGSCVDTDFDPAHCGGCGTACMPWEHCSGGSCVVACSPGYADCDGMTANGCEVELATDLQHCGACGALCDDTHATATCAGGVCSLACDPEYDDCDGDVSTGCETHLWTDVANCGTCGTACTAPAGGTATCSRGLCGFVVPASAVELWSTAVSATHLAIWADGTLHVTGGTTANVDATTGAASSFPGPVNRGSVWISAGVSQSVNGGSTDRRGFAQAGTLAWEWVSLGCCNDNANLPIDPAAGLGYTSQAGTVYAIDLTTGMGGAVASGGAWGRDAIDGASYWAAGYDGQVSLYDLGAGTLGFTVPIDPGGGPATPRLRAGAILGDGSFVVATTTGQLARVLPSGAVDWQLTTYAIESAPVVTGGGFIVAGSAASPRGIAVFQLDGTHVATVPTASPLRDLVAADGGRVYGLLASGELIAIDTMTGARRETYTGLPTDGEILLRGGVIYVLGGGTLHAVPVVSSGYDASSPWPVRFHDNQRTANAAASLGF